jgi:endonuclease YncB( thermonuclease family)
MTASPLGWPENCMTVAYGGYRESLAFWPRSLTIGAYRQSGARAHATGKGRWSQREPGPPDHQRLSGRKGPDQ